MFFYAALFVFCISLATLTLWMVRAIRGSHLSVMPGKRKGRPAKQRHGKRTGNSSSQPVDWGWNAGTNPSSSRRRHVGGRNQAFVRPRRVATISKPWGW